MPYKCPEKKRAANREYYKRNSDKVIRRTTEYQKKQSAEKKREWHLRHKYGLEIDQYKALQESQNFCCAICNERKDLVVDHCHGNGHVRGLLCFECNVGLGMFKDSATRLVKAIEYLKIGGKGGSCGI